jgi:NADH dehydrogenase (ubiquinone) 1 alpha subcomplex subunit 6
MASALTASGYKIASSSALSKRVVSLYRQLCRDIPRIIVMYTLEGYSAADVRRLVLKNEFRKHSRVTDPEIVELMLAKAAMEVEETMQQWKGKSHLQDILNPPVITTTDPFLSPEAFVQR